MKVVNIQAAKTHLSRIVDEVVGGEEVVLAKAGKPMVRLVPFEGARLPRKSGTLIGLVTVGTDCWTPDEVGFEAVAADSLYHGTAEETEANPKG